MKYICLICVLFFISCSPFGINSMGYEIPYMELDEAWLLTSSYTGIEDSSPSDSFKSPSQFVYDGGGDCEDFAIYLIYLLGPDAYMAAMYLHGTGHAIVIYDGKYIEPQVYGLYYDDDIEIIKTYSYDYLMAISTRLGTRAHY